MRSNQKYSKAKMFRLVAEYLSGGITQKQLSIREGINVGTFKYWYSKYRSSQSSEVTGKKTSDKTSSSDFIPITVSEATSIASSKLKVHYPNGVCLHLNVVLDVEGLFAVKKLVSCLD